MRYDRRETLVAICPTLAVRKLGPRKRTIVRLASILKTKRTNSLLHKIPPLLTPSCNQHCLGLKIALGLPIEKSHACKLPLVRQDWNCSFSVTRIVPSTLADLRGFRGQD